MPDEGHSTTNRCRVLIAVLLSLAVIACYWQVRGFDFVNYDDHRYITMNPRVQHGLTLDNAMWAFTTFEIGNWHPVTWLSHMADCSVFLADDNTQQSGGHHLVNMFLHAVNTVMLFGVLVRMTGSTWRSALVAALFGLHPLHVESVAWVSERKDVLSTMFGLLSIWAYLRWLGRRTPARYALIIALFALSLMSKPMLVTLPALLVLLDVWPLRRWPTGRPPSSGTSPVLARSFNSLIVEKLPLLILSMLSSVITMIAQISGGAVSTLDQSSIVARISQAIVSYAVYLQQTFWPVNLAPFYPRPDTWPWATVAISGVILALITGLAITLRRSRPWLLIGWLWYLISLLPVIGLVTIGGAAHADRYTYVPLIGIFIMLAWSIPAPRVAHRALIGLEFLGGLLVLGILMTLTIRQISPWRDSITLGEYTIAVTHDNAVAHFNLANALVQKGENERAITEFESAARLRPNWADVRNNLGNVYFRSDRLDQAILEFQRALAIRPDFLLAQQNLARAEGKLGTQLAAADQLAEALGHLERAVQLDPHSAMSRMFYATALADSGKRDAAREQFRIAFESAKAAGEPELAQEINRRMMRISSAATAPDSSPRR